MFDVVIDFPGFHAMHVFTTTPGDSQTTSGASYTVPTLSPAGRYALPPAFALCTFDDGGVGLYDLGKRRWLFLREQVSTFACIVL